MKEVVGFILYSIKNAFKINRIIKSKCSLADIAGQVGRLKKPGCPETNSVHQRRIAGIALFFSFFFPAVRGRRCFFSSLLIMKWAYHRGLAPKLNIGLRKGITDMEGHAWLSLNGAPFCERSTLYRNYALKLSETANLIYRYNEDR